jgi:hypothetical protein
MEWYICLLAIIGGFAAGFINTLAGSGSIITLPILIFLGLPANVANGTNRVGALLQTLVSVATFVKRGDYNIRESLWLIFPAMLGSLGGAFIAVDLDEETMAYTIGVVMVLLLVPVMSRKEQWLKNTGLDRKSVNKGWVVFVFSVLGAYGGFVQTGVGIFLLSAMVLLANYSIVHANVIKNVIVLCYTIPTFFIYWWHDLINWELGLVVASGQMLGSWIAARFAMEHKSSDFWIRRLLVAMIVVSAVELLGIREWVVSLI